MRKIILLLVVFLVSIAIVQADKAPPIILQYAGTDWGGFFASTHYTGQNNITVPRDLMNITFMLRIKEKSATAGQCGIDVWNQTNVSASFKRDTKLAHSSEFPCASMSAGFYNFTFQNNFFMHPGQVYIFVLNQTGISGSVSPYNDNTDVWKNGSMVYTIAYPYTVLGTYSFVFGLFGNDYTPPAPPSRTPYVIFNAPSEGDHVGDREVEINFTMVYYTGKYNECYWDSNVTTGWLNTTPVLNNTPYVFNKTFSADGSVKHMIMCMGPTATTITTGYWNFTIDTGAPVITVTQPSNGSYYNHRTLMQVDAECTDPYVYIFNMTLDNGTHIVWSAQNTTTSATSLTIRTSLNLSSYGDGNYNLNGTCSDAHTLKTWKVQHSEKDIDDGKKLTLDKKDVSVQIKNVVGGKLSKLKTVKEKDRIIFDAQFDKKVTGFEYWITADSLQEYYSNYSGHLIIDNLYWWDTEPYKPSYIGIMGDTAIIRITDIFTDRIISESIGGLNFEYFYYTEYADDTPPYFNVTEVNISTAFIGDWIRFSTMVWDSNPLHYIFAWNYTGTFANITNISCYQEFANVATGCGGSAEGNYKFTGSWVSPSTYAVDGNYGTYGKATTAVSAYLNITYKKPADAKNTGNYWQYKTGIKTSNVTIPLSCFNYNATHIKLWIISTAVDPNYVEFYCTNQNGSARLLNLTVGSNAIYEEGVYWNTQNYVNGDNLSYSAQINRAGSVCFQAYATDLAGNSNTSATACVMMLPYNVTKITYANYTTELAVNYTRYLNYSINYQCPTAYATNLIRYINGSYSDNDVLTCDSSPHSFGTNYRHPIEGAYNISFVINNSLGSTTFGIGYFTSDLYNPNITSLSLYIDEGFNKSTADVSMVCTDTVMGNVTYNLTFNAATMYYANITSGTNISNMTALSASATQVLKASCSDLFGTTSDTERATVYFRTIILIDEVTKLPYNVSNCSKAGIYYKDTMYYDLKGNNTNEVNFTGANDTRLRVELVYVNDGVINTYIDTSLVTTNMTVCANDDNTPRYIQYIYSATERQAMLKNTYAGCYIAADYTRFAYENSLILKAISRPASYTLYTYDDGEIITLAGIDGSISSNINLDTILFNRNAYDFSLLDESLIFQRFSNYTIAVYYKNLDNNVESAELSIYDMADNSLIFSEDTFTDPNEFTVYFSLLGLNFTNATTYKAILNKVLTDGRETSLTRYFDASGSSGALSNGLAIAISILMLVFGLSFTIARITFSWFGIFIELASLFVLTAATGGTTIMLMIVINVIILIYTVIMTIIQNYPSVT